MWSCLLKRNNVKSWQLESLHLKILAKSNQKHLTLRTFTFIYTSDNSIFRNVLHMFYLMAHKSHFFLQDWFVVHVKCAFEHTFPENIIS